MRCVCRDLANHARVVRMGGVESASSFRLPAANRPAGSTSPASVPGANDEKRRRLDARQRIQGKLRPAIKRHDCGKLLWLAGGSDQRDRGVGACGENADRTSARLPTLAQPSPSLQKPSRKEVKIKRDPWNRNFLFGQKLKSQRASRRARFLPDVRMPFRCANRRRACHYPSD